LLTGADLEGAVGRAKSGGVGDGRSHGRSPAGGLVDSVPQKLDHLKKNAQPEF